MFKIVIRKLKINAHQKPSTEKPEIKESANRIIKALMTNKNNPSVSMVMGIVNTTRTGLTMAFKNPSTAATIMATKKPEVETPGNKYEARATATALRINLARKFMIT